MSDRETKNDKAQRFVNEGRVTRLHERIYAVRGDTSRYLVCVPEASAALREAGVPASCTCEARGTCSHILASDAVEKHIAGGGTWPTQTDASSAG